MNYFFVLPFFSQNTKVIKLLLFLFCAFCQEASTAKEAEGKLRENVAKLKVWFPSLWQFCSVAIKSWKQTEKRKRFRSTIILVRILEYVSFHKGPITSSSIMSVSPNRWKVMWVHVVHFSGYWIANIDDAKRCREFFVNGKRIATVVAGEKEHLKYFLFFFVDCYFFSLSFGCSMNIWLCNFLVYVVSGMCYGTTW